MNKTLIVGFTTITLLLSGCTTQQASLNKQKAELHLQLGTSHLIKQNFPTALKELLQAEKFDPENPIIQNNLGLSYMVREKFIEAEIKFRRALALKSDYTDARNNLGRLFIELGLYQKAIDELQVATADLTYETPAKSWANLGQAYFFLGEHIRARDSLRNSLKFNSESCFALHLYSRSIFELKDYKLASESFETTLNKCQKNASVETYFYSGMSLYKTGKLDLARARFSEATRLNPKDPLSQKATEMLEIIR